MSRFFNLLLVGVLGLVFAASVQAAETVVVEKQVVVSPAPQSASCTTVNAHWEGNIWVDKQTVCKYENRPEGVAWVQDYWACKVFDGAGNCTSWEYQPGHWVKTYP